MFMLMGVDTDSIPLDSGRDKFNWSAGMWQAFIKQCHKATI